MDPIRKAISLRLRAEDAVTGLLTTYKGQPAIFHQVAPRDAEAPYVVFNKQDGRPRWTFDDSTQWDLWLIKGVCRGGEAEDAEDVDRAIRESIDDTDLVIEGGRCLVLRRDSDVDYSEPDGADSVHHVGAVYRLVTQTT